MAHPAKLGRSTLLGILLSLAAAATTARADVPIKLESGWTASIDGFVNAFVVDEFGDAAPAGVGDAFGRATDQGNFRIRTGFLPSKLGFKFGAPEWEGLKVGARVALYPQINNGGTRTSISPNIDFREFYFTIDGKFGQVLMGRALNLYQQSNILSDMSLFGVGVPSEAFKGGPTLGHVGFGYLYPAFDAQLRYTTPDLSGLKIAVALTDPSTIGATANVTSSPTLEAEATWSMKSGDTSVRAWLGGLYQQAKIVGATTTSVAGTGGHAGVGVGFGAFDVVASGFTGKGIGTETQLDSGNALDGANEERTSSGFLAQATFLAAGKTKLGASYGRTMQKQTTADKVTGGQLDNRQAITAGVYHDFTSWMKLVVEYTNAKITWFKPTGSTASAPTQSSNIVGAGMVVFF